MDRKSILNKHVIEFAAKLNVNKVLPSLIKADLLHQREVDRIKSATGVQESRDVLLDIVLRKLPDSFLPFYEGLVKSGQHELAKLLLTDDLSLPPVESLVQKNHPPKNGHVEIEITPPSCNAIKENEKFYQEEIKLFPEVPETCGVIEDMTVEEVDTAPSLLAFNPETTYRNFTKPKGLALVINNKIFKSGGLPNRLGTDVDARNIATLFEKLNYYVKVKHNLTSREMLSAMDRFAKKNEHETSDSAVVVVLTHGSHGALYGVDNVEVPVNKIISSLNASGCPALINKPKIFIIQACRGERYDSGFGHDLTDGLECGDQSTPKSAAEILKRMDETDANEFKKRVPLEADILIAYATTPGYVSWRNSVNGSWFVQGICETFRKNANKEEILHLLTEVNRLVAERLSGCGNYCQVPEPCSRLRKKFYFFPGVFLSSNEFSSP